MRRSYVITFLLAFTAICPLVSGAELVSVSPKLASKKSYTTTLKNISGALESEMGGVNGGGGNLDDEAPVYISHDQITQAVALSRLSIETTLRNVQIKLILGQNLSEQDQNSSGYTELKNLFSRFFTSNRDVYQVLAQVKINLQKSAACKDPLSGKPEDDGSVSGNSDEICISAFTLGQKLIFNPLSPNDYQPRIMALVFHEVAHLFGANEQDAMTIQKLILTANKNHAIIAADHFADSLDQERVDQIKKIIQNWIIQIKSRNYKFLAGDVGSKTDFLKESWVVMQLFKSLTATWPNKYRDLESKILLSETENELLLQLAIRIQTIWSYNHHVGFCKTNSNSDICDYANTEYEGPFLIAQSNSIPVYQWSLINILGENWKNGLWLYPNVKLMMKKYQSIDDSIVDIQDTLSRIDDLWPKFRERTSHPYFKVN